MSKKSSKTKASKAAKRTADQSTKPADTATAPARNLIPELAAMKLSPKIAAKLEALPETQQDRVLSYVNTGMKINDAYRRTVATTPEQQPEPEAATPTVEATSPEATPTSQPATEATPEATPGVETTPAAEQPGEPATQPAAKKPRRAPKAKAETGPKKLSAIDAAAKVLAEDGGALNCQEMIDAMAKKGYWTSPGGKTPAATLYSAILREVQTKGNDSRFKKTERGKFAIGKAS
jgi:hypothetical protein